MACVNEARLADLAWAAKALLLYHVGCEATRRRLHAHEPYVSRLALGNESRAYVYISNFDELSDFCKEASTSKVLAVDTEFLRERTYYPQLCLVQLATPDKIVAVDPILIRDLSPLAKLFSDTSIVKVIHACGQDMEVLLHAVGCLPQPVFDTQIVAAFLGHRMQMGYGALVEAYTKVHLPKAESLTDWSRRPLDPEQLKYAEDDVRYLPGIYDQMTSDLIAKDRLGWVKPELDRLDNPLLYQRDPRKAYLHLRRSSSLTRRQLSVAREVCAWRESAAARRNIPRKWVISDEVIVEMCRRPPSSTAQLRRIRGTEKVSERDLSAIVEAAQRGCDLNPSEYPELKHHAHPSAEAESIVDLMCALIRLVSEKTGVASQLIASRDDLYDLLVGNDTPVLHDWRYDIAGKQLQGLLHGEVGLTVKDSHVEIF